MSSVAVCCLAVWLSAEPAPGKPSSPVPPDSQKLDSVVSAEWASNGVVPELLVDDATFLRRAWLDLAGRVPPAAETEKFLASREPDKRSALVEKLLAAPEFANHWGRVWTEYLTDRRPFDEDGYNARVLQAWLRDAFESGRTYREIVQELITGSGPSDESGPANFFLRYNVEPVQLAGAVSRKFLGVTVQCAQCHHHPLAHWQKEDFWGLAAYFGRLRRMEPTGDVDDAFSLVVERTRGELQIPDMEAKPDEGGNYPRKSMFPRLPGTKLIDSAPRRREALAAWLTSDDNPYFARHGANRIWSQFFGAPLAASFDKLAEETASPKKAILDHLATEFRAHNTDVKWLIRTIVLSQTYQRGSGIEATASDMSEKAGEVRVKQLGLFARAPVKPLTADQVYLSIVQTTGYRGGEEASRIAETTKQDFVTDIPDETFTDQPLSMHRALSLLNGDYVREAINVAVQTSLQKHGQTPGIEHLKTFSLTALSRPLTDEETEQLLDIVSTGENGLQDAYWVLLNSAEFNTNH